MSRLVEALGGPVLAWECKQAVRGYWRKYFVLGYSAWLLLLAIGVMNATRRAFPTAPPTRVIVVRGAVPVVSHLSHLDLSRDHHAQLMLFLDSYVALLLQFQLLLVIAITPAILASCLGQEKERGTLFALFGTQLSSRQIVLGKLLGRLALLVPVWLTALPVLVFIFTATGRGLTLLLLALAQQVILAFAIGAVCLLLGVWIRRTADAVIVAYLVLGLGYAIALGLAPWVPQAIWFDPVKNLDWLLSGGSWLTFVGHLAVWALLGAACLPVAWGRLRQACLHQRDKRPSRRLWAFRPPVGNDAIRWRECYVIGLAPLPILRLVPRWLGLVGVFAFSTVIAGLIAENAAPGFLATLGHGNPAQAFAALRTNPTAIGDSVWLMGMTFVLLADLLLIVRCLNSVAEEKRRNTWDDLLLTAQSFREITNGKMWGILQATVPFIIAFALPVCLLAAVGGLKALIIAAAWILLPCGTVFVAALSGIDMLRVPRDMDETRPGGAFWFENRRLVRQPWIEKGFRAN
jgi:ABC-type transport system involved in multi-copper enzyme maturation permease subunit